MRPKGGFRGVEIFKTCPRCGKKFTEKEWNQLQDLGTHVDEEDGIRYLLNIRNCPCGSTIGIERTETI